MKIKKKYIDNPELLSKDLEELMGVYARRSMNSSSSEKYRHYTDGVSDGFNKAWKLIFDRLENKKSVQS